MFDDVVVVYKFLGDLMFFVTGDQDENEVGAAGGAVGVGPAELACEWSSAGQAQGQRRVGMAYAFPWLPAPLSSALQQCCCQMLGG
jgi:hypothetical protein